MDDDRKVEKIVRGEDQRLDFPSLLFFPFGLVLGVISVIVMAPFFVLLFLSTGIRSLRFRRSMRKQGRLVAWRDLERRLMDGEGTMSEEVGLKGAERVWWTPDDVASLGRLPSSYREVDDVLDGFAPRTRSATVEISVPDAVPRERSWAVHPSCGCTALPGVDGLADDARHRNCLGSCWQRGMAFGTRQGGKLAN